MTESTTEDSSKTIWDDDLLERRKYANFLTKTIRQRCNPIAPGGAHRAFTLAIDGDWGAGKSFFVNRWSKDLLSQEFAVVCFDAWKCDTTAEPFVALLSAINEQLEPLIGKLPPSEKATEAVRENWKLVKKSGRKLAVSAAKILASAALKHGAGLSIGDILQTESTDGTDETGGDASEDLSDSVEKLAEQLGAQLEKEYKARQHSISAFRENLERTVALLAKHGVVGAPLAVFVDELDRCRPDFAIKLLEVIKHLFDVPGVCFVVSINTLQLSESIRAVYGGGFDASHYLHRFFDLTYQLPAPDCYRFAKTLFAGWPENLRKMSRDAYVYSTLNGEDTQAHLFAAVSREFGLDLRAQKRVFETALAAAGGIPKDNPVHSMFLFFLSAMYVRRRAGWEAFWMKPTDLSAYQVWYLAQVRSLPTSTQLDDRNAQFETEIPNIDVRSVIYEYWRLATMSPEDLRAEVNAGRPDENRTLRRQILSAVSSRYGNSGRIAVYDYKVLIELAGQVV